MVRLLKAVEKTFVMVLLCHLSDADASRLWAGRASAQHLGVFKGTGPKVAAFTFSATIAYKTTKALLINETFNCLTSWRLVRNTLVRASFHGT